MRVNDLVEDREGDKAVVREVHEDGYVGIEWDCNPGTIARVHESRLSNLSEVVRELDGPDDVGMQEWLALLTVATDYMVAAEALIDGLKGDLGIDTRIPDAREAALRVIERRVTAYAKAREAFVKYAQERQALLS